MNTTYEVKRPIIGKRWLTIGITTDPARTYRPDTCVRFVADGVSYRLTKDGLVKA